LPIPVHFVVDAGPHVTAGQICARDPETGVDTTGFHRLMLKGRNHLVSMTPQDVLDKSQRC
jgi:2,5-furandicarboxylate decarboxylase 1